MLKKYVDDVLAGLNKLKLGKEWNQELQIMTWSNQAEELHRQQSLTEEKVTMMAVNKLASSIFTCLDFTYDLP